MTDLRRYLGVDVQYFGAWETQERGLLHRHVLLWAVGISERRMRAAFKLLAPRHDFGRVFDVQAISGRDARSIARTSGYIASYVSKGSERALCLNRSTGEMHEDGRGYRAWSCSRRWGTTIAAVKQERVMWAVSKRLAVGVPPDGVGGSPGAEGALDLESQIYATMSEVEAAFSTLLGAVAM